MPRNSSMTIIRAMSENDLEVVLHIEENSSLNPWTRKIFADCLKVSYGCWVLENTDKQILGFVVFIMTKHECHLLNIAVDPSHRHCGYGRFLLAHMIELSRKLALERVLLEVRQSNEIAINLYQSLGFMKVGIRKNYYKLENAREDAILMTLLL